MFKDLVKRIKLFSRSDKKPMEDNPSEAALNQKLLLETYYKCQWLDQLFDCVQKELLVSVDDMPANPISVCIVIDEIWVGFNYPGYEWHPGFNRYSLGGKLIASSRKIDGKAVFVNDIVYALETVWLATNQGVFSFDKKGMRKELGGLSGELSNHAFNTILPYSEGRILFGGPKGLAIWDAGGEFTLFYPFGMELYVTCLCVKDENTILVFLDDDNQFNTMRVFSLEELRFVDGSEAPITMFPSYPQCMLSIDAWNKVLIGNSEGITIIDTQNMILEYTSQGGMVVSMQIYETRAYYIVLFSMNNVHRRGLYATYFYKNLDIAIQDNSKLDATAEIRRNVTNNKSTKLDEFYPMRVLLEGEVYSSVLSISDGYIPNNSLKYFQPKIKPLHLSPTRNWVYKMDWHQDKLIVANGGLYQFDFSKLIESIP